MLGLLRLKVKFLLFKYVHKGEPPIIVEAFPVPLLIPLKKYCM